MSLIPQDKPARACSRCGAATTVWNVLRRTERASGVHLFRCGACDHVDSVGKER